MKGLKETINGKRPFGSHLVQQSLEAKLGDDQYRSLVGFSARFVQRPVEILSGTSDPSARSHRKRIGARGQRALNSFERHPTGQGIGNNIDGSLHDVACSRIGVDKLPGPMAQ